MNGKPLPAAPLSWHVAADLSDLLRDCANGTALVNVHGDVGHIAAQLILLAKSVYLISGADGDRLVDELQAQWAARFPAPAFDVAALDTPNGPTEADPS